ncbi:WD repeat-containing protein 74 [Halocaridina rubra]|uniref:WD repeat-containing protein 74 n=1 Tax=Halocaridina rubra TaxID=373956 RepID=A0AAN9A2T5_HALRR
MEALEEKESPIDFNVFVGAETGIFKGLNLNTKAVIRKNINSIKTLTRDYGITALAWGNQEQTEVLVACKNRTVQVYDTDNNEYVATQQIDVGEGPIVSLARYNGVTLTAVKSGQVTLWRNNDPLEINALHTGDTLARMRQSPVSPNLIATGGKENELQLWDLEKPESSLFKAKNVRHTMLNLRVPVWVTDMAFLEDNRTVAISTRYKTIRLYDPGRQRRPVMAFDWGEYPLTCIAPVSGSGTKVVVGSAHGRAAQFDFRGRSPEVPFHSFKGIAGAVRDIKCHPELSLTFMVGLDRFLRVYSLKSGRLLYNEYLKSRLNCLLIRDNMTAEEIIPVVQKKSVKRKKNVEKNEEIDVEEENKHSKTKMKKSDDDWAALTL